MSGLREEWRNQLKAKLEGVFFSKTLEASITSNIKELVYSRSIPD